MNTLQWKTFFLETNRHYGPVTSEEEWRNLRTQHGTLEKGISVLTRAQNNPGATKKYNMPKFDFHPFVFDKACETARTPLYEWAAEQGIDLTA